MERFRGTVRHTHEFTICGGWAHALCREVTNGPCGVAQVEWERCQGALGEVFQRERFLSGKLHRDVGEQEGEATLVLPGWSES